MELELKQSRRKNNKSSIYIFVVFTVAMLFSFGYLAINYLFNSSEIVRSESNTLGEVDTSCGEYEFPNQEARLAVETAKQRTEKDVTYDPAYISIDYPGGDVPDNTGVCTDVVIRAFRGAGIDLQKELHEDISANFNEYPSQRVYGLDSPDSNIDHRRVINLMKFFEREGLELLVTDNPDDYLPGDVIVWSWGGGTRHIGIISDEKSLDCKRFKVIHNGGWGTVSEDRLFEWNIIGHYRYF